MSILNRQVLEKEGESKELKRFVVAESEKSQKLEERLRLLQAETASSSARAAERSLPRCERRSRPSGRRLRSSGWLLRACGRSWPHRRSEQRSWAKS